eukprot:COSAG05_NODE_2304_length_3250_cov_3.541098_1_plen_329_part_00
MDSGPQSPDGGAGDPAEQAQAQATVRGQIDQLRQARAELEKQAERNAAALKVAQQRADVAERGAVDVGEQDKALGQRRGDLETAKNAYAKQLKAEQQKQDDLEAEHGRANGHFRETEVRIGALKSKATQLGAELDASLQEVSGLKSNTGGLQHELGELRDEKSLLDVEWRRLRDEVENLRRQVAQQRADRDQHSSRCAHIGKATSEYEAMCQKEVRAKEAERELTVDRCAKIVDLQKMLEGYKIRELVKKHKQDSPQDIEDIKATSDTGYNKVRDLVKKEKKDMGEPGPTPQPTERAEVCCFPASHVASCKSLTFRLRVFAFQHSGCC